MNLYDKSHSFESLVRANKAWVRGYLRSRLRDWASADDLAQDVFVTAYRRIGAFRGESSIEFWLKGIARNHLRNFLRKHREEAMGGSEELQEILDRSCNDWAHADGRLQALSECMHELPQKARQLLDERYVQGRNVREIAKKTNKGYSALTMQFHRMREILADCIEKQFQGGEA
jgi:RNA polymerase sigma-70 factor (ECF subfamily)